MKTRTGSEEMLRCSFCHKSQDAVAKLISSPSDYPRAYICDECVAVCNSILEDDRTATPASAVPNQLPKPQEVKDLPGRVRYWTGADQEETGGRGLQPLQAHLHEPPAPERWRGTDQVEHPADRADRHGQDAAGADPGAHAGCAVCDCGCDDADRGRLRRRGCREHHPEAPAGCGRRRESNPDRHHLYR